VVTVNGVRESIKGRNAGQWWPVNVQDKDAAIYYCQNCGSPMGIFAHQIKPDGYIEPSVVCPHVKTAPDMIPTVVCVKCDFHEWVRLIGWEAQ
jgi:hypothetical protein